MSKAKYSKTVSHWKTINTWVAWLQSLFCEFSIWWQQSYGIPEVIKWRYPGRGDRERTDAMNACFLKWQYLYVGGCKLCSLYIGKMEKQQIMYPFHLNLSFTSFSSSQQHFQCIIFCLGYGCTFVTHFEKAKIPLNLLLCWWYLQTRARQEPKATSCTR